MLVLVSRVERSGQSSLTDGRGTCVASSRRLPGTWANLSGPLAPCLAGEHHSSPDSDHHRLLGEAVEKLAAAERAASNVIRDAAAVAKDGAPTAGSAADNAVVAAARAASKRVTAGDQGPTAQGPHMSPFPSHPDAFTQKHHVAAPLLAFRIRHDQCS
jgi:hypothetical protein